MSGVPCGLAACIACSLPALARSAPIDGARVQAALTSASVSGEVPERDRAAVEAAVSEVVAEIQALAKPKTPSRAFDDVIRKINDMLPIGAGAYGRGGVVNPLVFKLFSARDFSIHFQDYLFAEEHGNHARAAMNISALNQDSGQLYPILPRSELIELVDATTNQEATSRNAIVDALVARLAALTDTAKTAADFDPMIAEIETAQEVNSNFDNDLAQSLQRLRFLTSEWQDYFLQLATNPEKASRTLQRMSQESGLFSAALREKVTERMPEAAERIPANPAEQHQYVRAAPTPTPASVPDPAGLTIDNLREYAAKLSQIRIGPGNIPISVASEMLGRMITAHESLLDGDTQKTYEIYNWFGTRLGDYEGPLERVREEMTNQALQVQFKDAGIEPEPSEKASAYGGRIIEAYIKAAKWQSVIDALAVANILGLRDQYAADIAAFQIFVTGTRQEIAGEYALAVGSYLLSLSSTGHYTPVDAIAARLKVIRADHHEEYADGYAAYMDGRAQRAALLGAFNQVGAQRPQQLKALGRTPNGTLLPGNSAASSPTPQPSPIHP
jgi:hypothetical protein